MAYQVLARKWRPRSFSTLVGQEHVVRALTHALNEKRLHHAYLFTGTRGVGKTTIARILAKSLNCETGISAEPCGKCAACTEIDAGRFVDLLEVDAATNTRVDEMRQLLENAVYAPTRGRFKVYVIDEVHMLSNAAFNAMLKTLEEPPEHIKFILATTDPQKIPVTVLSRCLQFNLKQMPQGAIAAHLARVAGEEGITTEPAALALLAHSARGSMRDALSLMDQAIAFTAGKVVEADVRAMLGTVDRGYLFDILERLARGDIAGMLAIAAEMDARSISFDDALQELGALLHRIALAQAVRASLADDAPDRERIAKLAELLDQETTQLYYQIVVHGRQDLPLAPDEYAGFTMTLIRMAVFKPEDGAQPVRAPAPARTPAPVAATPPPKSVAPHPPAKGADDSAVDWPSLVRELKVSGVAKQLAERSALVRRESGQFDLRVPPAAKHLAEKAFQEKLRAALEQHFGHPVRLNVEIGEAATGATVASQDEARRDSAMQRAESVMRADPFVRALQSQFDATIEGIQPVQERNPP